MSVLWGRILFVEATWQTFHFFCIPGVILPVILRRTIDLCFTSGTDLACVFEHTSTMLFVSTNGFPGFFNHILASNVL